MVRRSVSCQTLDEALEQALATLDPEDSGTAALDRVIDFDWAPLLELMEGDMATDGEMESGTLLALSHKLERFRDLIEPFAREEGPLADQLSKLTRQTANPYRKQGVPSPVPVEVHRVL
jgi:hypothetical protein